MTGDGPGTVGMTGLGRRLIFYGAQFWGSYPELGLWYHGDP